MISFNTSVAILSVFRKSVGSPDVQTHLNGPKPKENMSLKNKSIYVRIYNYRKARNNPCNEIGYYF